MSRAGARRHPSDGPPCFGRLRSRLTRPPGEIQGDDREELIGTGGCRLSLLLCGDGLNRNGDQFQCASHQTFPYPVERRTDSVGGQKTNRYASPFARRSLRRCIRLKIGSGTRQLVSLLINTPHGAALPLGSEEPSFRAEDWMKAFKIMTFILHSSTFTDLEL